MKNKMITLCDETFALAKLIPNFSEWVRARLLETDERRKEQDDKAFKIWKETGNWPEWYN